MEDYRLVIAGVTMFAAFIGVIICAKKQKVYPRAKNFAIPLFLVVILCCFIILKLTIWSGNQSIAKGLAFRKAVTYVVADKVKKAHPGEKILVILPPSYNDQESVSKSYETSMLEVFQETIGPKSNIAVARLNIPMISFGGGSPEEYDKFLATQGASGEDYAGEPMAKHFNEIFSQHKDAKVIVSFVGLPYSPDQLEKLSIWTLNKKERPSLYLLEGDLQLLPKIKNGSITGLVVYKKRNERIQSDKYPEDNYLIDFDKRYHYLDKNNASELMKK